MPSRLPPFIYAIAALVLLSSCTDLLKPKPPIVPTAEDAAICERIHTNINRYRTSNGKEPLARLEGMDAIALTHCKYLLKKRGTSYIHGKNVTHMGSEWRAIACSRRCQMDNYGENVAALMKEPEELPEHLVLMWKTSYYHNNAMLGDWTHTGINLLTDKDGMAFITQIYASE